MVPTLGSVVCITLFDWLACVCDCWSLTRSIFGRAIDRPRRNERSGRQITFLLFQLRLNTGNHAEEHIDMNIEERTPKKNHNTTKDTMKKKKQRNRRSECTRAHIQISTCSLLRAHQIHKVWMNESKKNCVHQNTPFAVTHRPFHINAVRQSFNQIGIV